MASSVLLSGDIYNPRIEILSRRSVVPYNPPMRSAHLTLAFAVLAATLLPSANSHADGTRFPGTRALGMGGALRAAATGDSALQLNPSGISLARAYFVEAAYQHSSPAASHDVHASVVDSTSGFNVGGGFYYSYLSASPTGLPSANGHQLGIPLSFPFLDKVFLGATGKYLRLGFGDDTKKKGFTIDVGLTLRPIPFLSLAAIGYNLNDLGTAWAPRAFGGGIAILPMPILLIGYDMVWETVYGDPTREKALYYMGGAEFTLDQVAAFRAGGGKDGLTKNGYFSVGFSGIQSQVGALDIGFRRDISGHSQATILSVSARIFVPAL